jgi:hypothetical protein
MHAGFFLADCRQQCTWMVRRVVAVVLLCALVGPASPAKCQFGFGSGLSWVSASVSLGFWGSWRHASRGDPGVRQALPQACVVLGNAVCGAVRPSSSGGARLCRWCCRDAVCGWHRV